MNPEQPNNQYQMPDQPAPMPPSYQAPPQPPAPQKSSKKWMVIVIILLLLLAAAAAAWFMMRDDKSTKGADNTQAAQESQTQTEESEETADMTTTAFTSGLVHKTTVSFTHPSSWAVKSSEEKIEGQQDSGLKSLTISSPTGIHLHIFDRDGLGGGCDANGNTYTLTKKLATKTNDFYFKQYNVPSSDFLNGVLMVEAEGQEWSVPAHDALQEGDSLTNTCNISSYSTIGASGVFVTVNDKPNLTDENIKRLGWDDIKDDTDFVRMLESMEAVDKSGN